jgi:hypothetical protein
MHQRASGLVEGIVVISVEADIAVRLFHDPVYRGERILGSPRRHARNGLALPT